MSLIDLPQTGSTAEFELVSPALELATAQPVRLAPGVEDLMGCAVGLVDNGKWNAAVFLRAVSSLMAERFGTSEGPSAAKKYYNRDLTEQEQSELAAGSQVTLAAIGDCGSCTSYTVRDALVLESLGVPTVALVTEPFLPLARGLATTMGTPEIRIVAIPHPLYGIAEGELAQRARGALTEVAGALMEHRA
jgi:hypothetical protein